MLKIFMRHSRTTFGSAVALLTTLQIISLTAASNSYALTSTAASPSLKVVPQFPVDGTSDSLTAFGRSLGGGVALVTSSMADDAAKPIIPRAGATPAESPIVQVSTNQVLAPIVNSLPRHSVFTASIMINGKAVRLTKADTAGSPSLAMPAFVGTQKGTFLVKLSGKKINYFYKVMFISDY